MRKARKASYDNATKTKLLSHLAKSLYYARSKFPNPAPKDEPLYYDTIEFDSDFQVSCEDVESEEESSSSEIWSDSNSSSPRPKRKTYAEMMASDDEKSDHDERHVTETISTDSPDKTFFGGDDDEVLDLPNSQEAQRLQHKESMKILEAEKLKQKIEKELREKKAALERRMDNDSISNSSVKLAEPQAEIDFPATENEQELIEAENLAIKEFESQNTNTIATENAGHEKDDSKSSHDDSGFIETEKMAETDSSGRKRAAETQKDFVKKVKVVNQPNLETTTDLFHASTSDSVIIPFTQEIPKQIDRDSTSPSKNQEVIEPDVSSNLQSTEKPKRSKEKVHEEKKDSTSDVAPPKMTPELLAWLNQLASKNNLPSSIFSDLPKP